MLNLSTSTLLTAKQTLCMHGGLNYLSKLPARKLAIFASKRSYKQYNVIEKLMNNKKRFTTKLFIPSWTAEPKLSEIKGNLEELISFSPDWIVAIGGGSVIDGVKIAWTLYENPNFNEEDFIINYSIPQLRKKAKFVAVPTTPGTGSETSSSAILTSEDGKKKIPVVCNDFLPDLSILDSTLLADIPIKILVPSMLDALAHCLEGYMSKVENMIANNLASLSLLNLFTAFKNLKTGKNYQDFALIGAYYAGIIQNINVVGPAHALAHNLPEVPHAVATGFLLPSVININIKKDDELKIKYDRLTNTININSINTLLDQIYKEVIPSLGIKPKISHFAKLQSKYFDVYAKLAYKDSLNRYFPAKYSENDFVKILKESY